MEPIVVQTEQMRKAWINRPRSQSALSFDEWLTEVSGSASNHAIMPVQDEAAVGRGRHKAGEMNKLETRYAQHLELRKHAGEIREYRFEPMKLRLAPSTFFDIDFLVMVANFDIELHEVKGHWEDDARVKIKVAARMFPWWTFRGVQWDKVAKDWKFEEFKA